jgi:hypothetical protein
MIYVGRDALILGGGCVALWGFNSFLHYLAPLRPPWQTTWGGNYREQISVSYLYYLD